MSTTVVFVPLPTLSDSNFLEKPLIELTDLYFTSTVTYVVHYPLDMEVSNISSPLLIIFPVILPFILSNSNLTPSNASKNSVLPPKNSLATLSSFYELTMHLN